MMNNTLQIRFSSPDPITNAIEVVSMWPNGLKKTIGLIFARYDDDTDSVIYNSENNINDELIPASTDFNEVERHFERIANRINEQSLNELADNQEEEHRERSSMIQKLRKHKSKSLLKLFTR